MTERDKTRREKLDLQADVLLLRVCLQESDGDTAEALMDFNLIKDLLELQKASVLVYGYWRKGRNVTPKKWLLDAMDKRITDDILSRETADPERDAIRKTAHPVVHNRLKSK